MNWKSVIISLSRVKARFLFANISPLITKRASSRQGLAKVVSGGLFTGAKMNRRHFNKEKILERDQYICVYCLGDATCVEHVVPWDWSHCNDEDNLVASCTECNQIASDKMFTSFDEKRAYILVVRSSKKWTRKLAIKFQVFRCSNCKAIFNPLKDGATNFLCPECTKKEYGDD